MNHEQKELLRHAVLLQLEVAAPATMPLRTLLPGVRLAGHLVEPPALQTELNYLAEKGLISRQSAPLSRAIKRYALTAAGRDYLEENGLA